MTVKELHDILHSLPDDLEVTMVSVKEDNLNSSYSISDIVKTTVYVGSEYRNELILIPE